MELRQLRYFVKAAETLNFSEAAKALAVTQSTLSQQIRQLETELDITLFQRNSHEVTLTEAGEQLLPSAIATLRSADVCRQRLDDLRDMLTGTLNIGVTYTFSPILTETLITFMKEHPRVKLNITYEPMADLMERLARRQLDFVLAFKPSHRYGEIESHCLFDNRLCAVVRDGHPLARRESVSVDELERYEMALPSRGLQARNAFETIDSLRFDKLRVRIELNEVNILLKLIKATDLVTILSEATIHDEQGVKAVTLAVAQGEMAGCVHMLRNVYRKHAALEFIKMLSESNAIRQRVSDWLK